VAEKQVIMTAFNWAGVFGENGKVVMPTQEAELNKRSRIKCKSIGFVLGVRTKHWAYTVSLNSVTWVSQYITPNS
jgi:hypothetical protein